MSARLRRRVGHWVGGCARAVSALAMAAALAGCGASSSLHTPEVMEIAVLGFNDFHGNLEPPRLAVPVPASTGASQVPAGGAAYFAGAVAALKAQHPHHLLVSAGDMVGASPLVSALFLDEPTIHAFNLMGVDFHAPGNHEFDNGVDELARRLAKIKCPVVCANYDFSKVSLSQYVKPYTILKKASAAA